jgi:DNA-directed RNA polymerase subunit RPC12/RpoP
MPIYNLYKCPRCGKSLFQELEGAKGVSSPLFGCGNCGAVIDVRQLCNEWELMTDDERTSMGWRVPWYAAQVGGSCGALPPLAFASWILDTLGIMGGGDLRGDWPTGVGHDGSWLGDRVLGSPQCS